MSEFWAKYESSNDLPQLLNAVSMMLDDMRNSLEFIGELCLDKRGPQEIDPAMLNGMMRMLAEGGQIIKDKVDYCTTLAMKKGAAA